MTMDKGLSLTNNDVALAFFGVAHMINFWKRQSKSDYTRREIAKCEALATKLNAICEHFEPPLDEVGEPSRDSGGEVILSPLEAHL